MSYASVAGHRRMALDTNRNDAYARALAEVITPDTVVLDLGAGTGVHGLVAARLGARHVYLVEPEDVIALAEEIAAANGLADRVTAVQGRIEDVELPERVDVIVSTMTGSLLVTEDLLGALFVARDRFLKPGGHLVPAAGAIEAMPVRAARLHGELVAGWSGTEQGIDFGPARRYAANTIYYQRADDVAALADPRRLRTMEFATDDDGAVRADVDFAVTASGECHGWLAWLTIRLGQSWLSAGPEAPRVHWTPAFLPVDPPLPLASGDRVRFTLERLPHGDWTWSAAAAAGVRRHSTLLARPMTLATLERAALDYRPHRTVDGDALQHALALADGTRQTREIAADLAARFPRRFRTAEAAVPFVQRVLRHYA